MREGGAACPLAAVYLIPRDAYVVGGCSPAQVDLAGLPTDALNTVVPWARWCPERPGRG